MKKLKRSMRCYFALSALTAIAGILLALCIPCRYPALILPMLLLCIAAVCAGLTVRKIILLRAARLITENRLFQISPVMLAGIDGRTVSDPETEIVVSCFGVLINSRIVRFNRKSNRLWRVEIGRDSLKLIYGTKTSQEQMTLLHGPISEDTAHRLAERFRVETGAKTIFTLT